MGSFSVWHWLIVMVVVLLLFGGGGKIPRIMADLARGVKAFKDGIKEPEPTRTAATKPEPDAPQKIIDVTAEPVMPQPVADSVRQDEQAKG